MKAWQYLKGVGILLLLLVGLMLLFKYISLYGAYLQFLGVVFVCLIIIGIFIYAGYNIWRILKDWFNGPRMSSG